MHIWFSYCLLACLKGVYYGRNCTKVCKDRQCANTSSSCDGKNGICVGGCEAGWRAKDCSKRM